MPRVLIKCKLHFNRNKPKIKQEPNETQSNLPPNFQTLKKKLLSRNGYVENKKTLI